MRSMALTVDTRLALGADAFFLFGFGYHYVSP